MISPYFKIGFECENIVRELKRFERGIKPNLFLIEDGKKIINNLIKALENNENPVNYHNLEEQTLYMPLISDEIRENILSFKEKDIEKQVIKTESKLGKVSRTIDAIIESKKPSKDYIKTSIDFFENIGEKCFSYANADSGTYN